MQSILDYEIVMEKEKEKSCSDRTVEMNLSQAFSHFYHCSEIAFVVLFMCRVTQPE